MRSSRKGNLLLRDPPARGEYAVRILFYMGKLRGKEKSKENYGEGIIRK